MYLGEVTTKQLISVALMIMFALAAMFFIGYKYAYDQAIVYANDQIEEKMNEYRINRGVMENPDVALGNIKPFDFGGQDER